MSQIIGDALVAGGSLSPQAEAIELAVDRLLAMVYLYGWPEGRGGRVCVYDAIKALCPEAIDCEAERGAREAWKRHGIRREDDDE